MKLFISIVILIVFGIGAWYLFTQSPQNTPVEPTQNVEEDSKSEEALEESTNFEVHESDAIRVSEPLSDTVVSSPLTLAGEARGSWLFEATAPVTLTDWNGLIIAEGYIEATEDWMTTDFVPFTGTLEFEVPEDIGDFSDMGSLIFHKANPSGLPEHDAALEYRVRFR